MYFVVLDTWPCIGMHRGRPGRISAAGGKFIWGKGRQVRLLLNFISFQEKKKK